MYGMLPSTGGISPLRILYLSVALVAILGGVVVGLVRNR